MFSRGVQGRRFFCDKKQHVKVNAFSVLSQPESFDVDLTKIEKEFRELQFKFHPDQAAQSSSGASAGEVESRSAALNEAVRILRNPVWRAEHLLALKGQSPLQNEDSRIDDPLVMQRLIELQTEFEEAVEDGDDAGRERILGEVRADLELLAPEFAKHYRDDNMFGATQVLTKMILLDRFLARMDGAAT